MHAGSRYFGHPWKKGDVVGCMINMEDKSMIFTLNGELLITNKGSELCFTDFETEDGGDFTAFHSSLNGSSTSFLITPLANSSRFHPCVQPGYVPNRTYEPGQGRQYL